MGVAHKRVGYLAGGMPDIRAGLGCHDYVAEVRCQDGFADQIWEAWGHWV